MIGILDYGFGNLASVWNAVYNLGFDVEIVKKSERFSNISHLIIPGVGAFDSAMNEMHARGLVEPVLEFAREGKPTLGICLGMQLLADFGEETTGAKGLGLIPGEVRALPTREGFTIPHCGWNTVQFLHPHPVLKKIKSECDFYFVHTYRFLARDKECVLGTTEHSTVFDSVVFQRNILGFQFHPEKSQTHGLQLLENFCHWKGTC